MERKDCRHLGKLAGTGTEMCLADDDVSFPNCSDRCPNYEKAVSERKN